MRLLANSGFRHTWLVLLCAFTLSGGNDAVYAAPRPKTYQLAIGEMRFSPAATEINVGDTVVWKNTDPFPHTVTADDHSFDSGEIATGRSWKFRATKAGKFPYGCKLHPTMRGALGVKPK